MADYRSHSGIGSLGSAVITNDDKFLLDIPEVVEDNKYNLSKVKDKRSY